MNHTGTKTIETQRLIMRKMTENDIADIYEYVSREETTKYLYMPTHTDIAMTRDYVTGWIAKYEKPDFYHWCMQDKQSGKVIGNVMLIVSSERDLTGEIAYYMNSAYGGRGLMTEAIRAALEYGFNVIGLNRIAGANATENPASGKVMQKAGMSFEGTARQNYRNRLGFHDSDKWAMLKSDLK